MWKFTHHFNELQIQNDWSLRVVAECLQCLKYALYTMDRDIEKINVLITAWVMFTSNKPIWFLTLQLIKK